MDNTQQLRQKTITNLKNLYPSGLPTTCSTEKLADILGVRPQTVRRGFCLSGHYLGLIPVKLGNRRLLWPLADEVRP